MQNFHPLNAQDIYSYLEEKQAITSFKLHIFQEIDSTNSFLKKLPEGSGVAVCCSESQTQGRGRFGRYWHSPFGENLYFSLRWPFKNLSGLSLLVSLAILAVLDDLKITESIKIKWPNDILWKGKKLCGILVEIQKASEGLTQAVIGIGLNINSDTANQPLSDREWCSLFSITGKQFDRNDILASLLVQLERYFHIFTDHGLHPFLDIWKKHDALDGKEITLTYNSQPLTGIVRGIHPDGSLLLEDASGTVHYLSS